MLDCVYFPDHQISFAYVNDVKSLLDSSFTVKGELGIDFRRHLSGNDVENLATELDEKTVKSSIDLVLLVLSVLLSVSNGGINELCVLGLLCGGEDQRRVGGGILGLVLGDGGKVTRVADDGL